MSILKDFRAALGDERESVVGRLLRTGVRPTELAEAVMEYLRDQQEVTDDGVLVPNVLRITLGTKDHERLARYGVALPRALGTVVVDTATDHGWVLVGPVKVRIDRDELVRPGTYRLVGRIEAVDGWAPTVGGSAPAAAPARSTSTITSAVGASDVPADGDSDDVERVTVRPGAPAGVRDTVLVVRSGVDAGGRVVLDGGRVTAGRGTGCDLVVRDTTVSREHAAFVLRADTWWVLDLGSTNGTRVNGLRAAEHPIVPGDRIELGDVVVELVED
jgi:hypothetical protein